VKAIRALSDHNLGPGSAVVSSKLVQIFFDTMLRYGKDRSIQVHPRPSTPPATH
jgi:hypothetical protein